MGQEVAQTKYSEKDFANFRARLSADTALLKQHLQSDSATDNSAIQIGCELEGWLLDDNANPAARNTELLQQLDNPQVVPELASFNFELNTEPQLLAGQGLDLLHQELQQTWQATSQAAQNMGCGVAAIGILPSAKATDFTPNAMSAQKRYQALNEQVLRLRKGQPIEIDIDGKQPLRMQHNDVLLEAAATSFQMHLAVPLHMAARLYNASKIISAITVASNSNSPLLFGHRLWHETRIPLFEQAVSVGGSEYGHRVTFGIRYIQDSLDELFDANLMRYPILLPALDDGDIDPLAALRLHNGTIWRWNRPLVNLGEDGKLKFRLEHRVTAAGPSLQDNMASMALYIGLAWWMVHLPTAPEQTLPFAAAKDNFYNAAKNGLDARILWFDGQHVDIGTLLESQLLQAAEEGLLAAGVAAHTARHWLDIVANRSAKRRSGSEWLLHAYDELRDLNAVTAAYQAQQQSGKPIHQWDSL